MTDYRILPLAAAMMMSACATYTERPLSKDLSENFDTAVLTPVSETAETGWKIEDQWLLATSHHGLTLDQQSIGGDFRAEYGDQRGDLVVTVNDSDKTLTLYHLATQQTQTSVPLNFAPEGLCLYQPALGNTQLFILGDDHLARHYFITSGKDQALLREIRTLPLPPEAKNCAVSDEQHTLFISEESMGVWAYPASPEAPYQRVPVDLIRPMGTLPGKAGALSMVDDTLFIASAGDRFISSYKISTDAYTPTKTWSLPEGTEAESLRTWASETGVEFSLFDDALGQLLSGSLALETISPENAAFTDTQPAITITPMAETTPVNSAGDAADDPAIWVNSTDAEKSRILGTDKQHGLDVYDLSGELLQRLDRGRLNNVDVRYNMNLAGNVVDIAAASHRDLNAISLFSISQSTGHVRWLSDIETTLDGVYGLCMAQTNGRTYVFINDKDGRYEQYQITSEANTWAGTLVREFALPSQPEGCVADDQRNLLFTGEEDAGVWLTTISAENAPAPELIIEVSEHLVADVEGLSIYHEKNNGNERNYLVISSQGDDSYVLYEAEAPYSYVGRFSVGMNAMVGIDGASETDGLDVTSQPLGTQYPKGIMVVQDGRNVMPTEHQNFKIINWEDVESAVIQRK